jgi:ABC-2 type transport system ATP-binding protein
MLAASVETLAEQYVQLTVGPDEVEAARALRPFYEREIFGRVAMFFDGQSPATLGQLGDVRTPSIADLFVAKMQAA